MTTETVKCAACGCIVPKDDADRRYINEGDEEANDASFVCRDCSGAIEKMAEGRIA